MKKSVMTAVAAVVCAAMGLCACSSEGENAFTGDETKEPEYQAKLNAISPRHTIMWKTLTLNRELIFP